MERKIFPGEYHAMQDHDLLVTLCIKHDSLEKHFDNHLQHHFRITVVALSAALMGLASFVSGLILLLVKFGVG